MKPENLIALSVKILTHVSPDLSLLTVSSQASQAARRLCARAGPIRLAAQAGSSHLHPRGRDGRPGGAR